MGESVLQQWRKTIRRSLSKTAVSALTLVNLPINNNHVEQP